MSTPDPARPALSINEELRSTQEQLLQKVRELSVLQELMLGLPNPPVLTETASAMARTARQAIPGLDACIFFVYHPESETLVPMGGDWEATLDVQLSPLTTGASEKIPVADAFTGNRCVEFEDHSTPFAWNQDALLKTYGFKQLYYWPLTVEQKPLGVLALGTRRPEGLGGSGKRLGQLIAHHAAVLVERSRLYERLHSANQKLEQINNLKNEFISMVSHELRTPLTTIKGFVSIVLGGETGALNKQQKHFLETSDRAIDRLTLLVSDLLDISRMEAGQIKMQLRPSVLKDVLARIATNFAPQLKEKNLQLNLSLPKTLPPVMADPDRLSQVFDNLISNAIKFTRQGGITISAADKGDFVMISVQDSGMGIPKEDLERVFDKFYQVKSGGGYPSKGTGLGLAIARSIVESHRGKIWVESEFGKGADFRFILPRARADAAPPPPKQ